MYDITTAMKPTDMLQSLVTVRLSDMEGTEPLDKELAQTLLDLQMKFLQQSGVFNENPKKGVDPAV